jgi:hypothetical protein
MNVITGFVVAYAAFEAESGASVGGGILRVSGSTVDQVITSVMDPTNREISLVSAPLSLWRGGHLLRPGAGLAASAPATSSGVDARLGPFNELSQSWTCAGEEEAGPCLVTSIRVLERHAAVVWRQEWPRGTSGAPSLGTTTQSICAFPSFEGAAANSSAAGPLRLGDLGFVTWTGEFAVTPAWRAGRFPADYGKWPGDWGVYAGPLSLFDESARRGLVLGPLSGFTASVNALHEGDALAVGPHGMIEELPAGYSLDTVLVLGGGVVAAQMDYGSLLLVAHAKQRLLPNVSVAVRALMYSADGYPYYDPASGNGTCGNYEDVYLALQKGNRAQGLPYRTSMLDSFWYGQAVFDGVWRWDDRSPCFRSRFPRGLPWLRRELGMEFVAHLGTWLQASPYAARYKFVNDAASPYALPAEAEFWEDLFWNATHGDQGWGLSVMKQDHQDQQIGCDWNHGTPVCHRWEGMTSPTLISDWLGQMARGAAKSGVTIEYGTTIARNVLNTVTAPAVTHARGANDYAVRAMNDSWRVGAASGFFWSVGLYTTKDTFFSSNNETTPRGGLHGYRERHPELHALVSALSAGPVSPSDAPGSANVSLIMKVCRDDGELLKPDAPAMPMDHFWIGHAFCKDDARIREQGSHCRDALLAPRSEVWATATRIGRASLWPLIFTSLNSTSDFPLKLSRVYHHLQSVPTLHRDGNLAPLHWQPPQCGWVAYRPGWSLAKAPPRLVGPNDTLSFAAGSSFWDFSYVALAPIVVAAPGGLDWALLGECTKFVPVSRQRILGIDSNGTSVTIALTGKAREQVTLTVALLESGSFSSSTSSTSSPANLQTVAQSVILDQGGQGVATFDLRIRNFKS